MKNLDHCSFDQSVIETKTNEAGGNFGQAVAGGGFRPVGPAAARLPVGGAAALLSLLRSQLFMSVVSRNLDFVYAMLETLLIRCNIFVEMLK